jgi:hypothetical protein
VSPRRGDQVTVPPPAVQWDVRFATGDAATRWEELCRHALANTRRCLEIPAGPAASSAIVHPFFRSVRHSSPSRYARARFREYACANRPAIRAKTSSKHARHSARSNAGQRGRHLI